MEKEIKLKIDKAVLNEKGNFSKIKKLIFKRDFPSIYVARISNKGRDIFNLAPTYSGIIKRDKKFIDRYCELNSLNEREKKKIFISSGEERYRKTFVGLLKNTKNTFEELEEIMKMKVSR